MPFAPTGGAAPSTGTAILRVDPDQVLRLRDRLAAVRDEVDTFVRDKRRELGVRPLGADPVSIEIANAFNANAQSAVVAAKGFVAELTRVVDALDQAAKAYRLTDHTQKQAYQPADR